MGVSQSSTRKNCADLQLRRLESSLKFRGREGAFEGGGYRGENNRGAN